jgi:hypothetical protein
MKRVNPLIHMSLFILLTIMMLLGTAHSASVTMQSEVAIQKGQECEALKNDVTLDESQSKFTPQKSRDKNSSVVESETGRHSMKMERYKPYSEGEGERKIR